MNDTAVAVVADTWWRAKTALEALPIVWDEGSNGSVSSAGIAEHLKEGLGASANNGERRNGDAVKAIESAAKRVEADYGTPFLAHATMEVMNATVRLSADKAEAWVPTQNAEASLAALSEASGCRSHKCEVYGMDLGGGFGRRGGTQDYLHQATAIAKAFPNTPIKLIWSREEDQAHDFYRPISQCRLSAGLDAQGNLTGLHVRVSGQSINATLNPGGIVGGKDIRQLQGLYEQPGDAQLGYSVPNLLIEYVMRNTHVPVGPWRGVNTNQNAVYVECFMDEVARAAGKDPLEFRRAFMGKHPKHLAVLNAAAEKAGWGRPLPAGVFRGLAQFMGYGSYSAAVAEVSVSDRGQLKVHRLVLALDCGHAVNPDQIAAQVEGSVAYGLTATLYGECRVRDGRMVDLNFDTYQIMRLAEMPKVETVIVTTHDFWGGVGEPTISVVAPAVLNAHLCSNWKARPQSAAQEREARLTARQSCVGWAKAPATPLAEPGFYGRRRAHAFPNQTGYQERRGHGAHTKCEVGRGFWIERLCPPHRFVSDVSLCAAHPWLPRSSTKSGTAISSASARMAAISSISIGTCCMSCTRPMHSSNWRNRAGRCAART